MRTAVITLVAGRHDHLRRQRAALDPGVHHVVVAMGEGEVERCRAVLGDRSDVIGVDATPAGLPLARARNAGAEHALEHGAELLVFLDVDCIPSATLLPRYRDAAATTDAALLCGPVGYLPPGADGDLHALAQPHPARPVPAEDELVPGGDHALFWTLSFAVTAGTWRRIGGFCEAYVGYGGEDTDFGQLAARAGVELVWVGGAWAYHQHHETQSPPVQHLADIVRNGGLFRDRWGWWPMGGWLQAFAERGLVRHDAATDRWVLA
ncbi:GT2 family glycosyltransferase [Solirubrobacter pauli]|uniref:GT2 family glycosyltransferase n=1 Tax=Solirubrobacter pauli TaxID=166793 RepID=A0A660LG88_9ACTN|nr:galactosyltransferase-related protein [Solirubrobacter pauli]RKQ93286.1 GT2 family glycosyltransferase [Solirubrobacter pauli]